MREHITGEPAFPRPASADQLGYVQSQAGMTLRDWFAGLAMTRELFKNTPRPGPPAANFARNCYAMADAMLAERDKETTE